MTPQLRGHLAMLVFSTLVAGSFSLGSLTANHIEPSAFNAVRFILAAIVLGLAALATTGIDRSAFRSPWRYLVLGGFFAIYFVLMFEGLKTAPPVSAAAVFTMTPIMAAGFGWILLRQILSGRTFVALLIGGVGALWVIFRADLSALLRFQIGWGEIVYFIGCASHAVYTPLVKKLNRGENAIVFAFGTLVGGGGLLLIYGGGDIARTDWANLPVIVWITLAYITVFATAASFVLVQYSVQRLPAAKVMAYTYLVPSWVIVWEVVLGQPIPHVLVLGGVGLTIIALGLLLRDDSK
ncbi:DMT family transporter [Cochlodiniinecator piscidefendens]|uniref:DMT family transporter n=1 Tax=Cochlodiniinecator piscidefendens TaxID=2715756 RepID=UPI001408BCE7|nr:DMT family transporter [Cochlodiniinecator piscidefendens]